MATIDDVNAAIAALVSAGVPTDYTVGDKTFKNSQKMEQLLALRKQLMENPEADVSLMQFDFNVNEFGQDKGQYL